MATPVIKELLEAGVHFGHQTKRWNPKMKKYIFGERNGIYIVDLEKTSAKLEEACQFLRDLAARGGKVLFVGTKKQAQETIREQAKRCEMFYATDRWLGGTLTNFETIRKGIEHLNKLSHLTGDPARISQHTKKEQARLEKEKARLHKNLGGLVGLDRRPDALVVVDSKKEETAVEEANRLGIPVVGLVDTNCDPDKIDHVIPGNDDAIKAIRLVTTLLANSILDGVEQFKASGGGVQKKEEEVQKEETQEAAAGTPAEIPAETLTEVVEEILPPEDLEKVPEISKIETTPKGRPKKPPSPKKARE